MQLATRHPLSPLASRFVFAAVLAISVSACAPLATQSPGGKLTPVNAVAEGEDKHLMLFGHDVVAYFTEGKHRAGLPALKTVHEGVTFRFATAEHKALFEKNPAKYLPEYGGYCANGIVYGIPWGGNADSWKMINGKLYIFGGNSSRDGFMVDPDKHIQLADQYWKNEVAGSNAFMQRTYRLMFKVPHYKSGKEVADEVAKKGVKS